MSSLASNPSAPSQEGLTLVELVISMSLLLLVLAAGGALLMSGLKTQETTQAVTKAANVAQQITNSVQAGVRNATAVAVTSDNEAGTQLLVARTIGVSQTSTAASCQAWFYTPANGGSVYTKISTPAAPIAVPVDGPQGSWLLLGTGVSPADSATGRVFNAPTGSRVEIKFNVAAGTHPYVLINTTTYTPQMTTVSAPCF